MYYKGYTGKATYEADDHAFHGHVIGINDVVHFQGETVEELEKAFRDSVDDYLAFCKKLGEKPNKPYSGKLVFRTTPEIHRRLAIAAELEGKSLNQVIEEAVLHAVPPQ